MTELQRYLAEEIAIDHADGLIARREAVRRLLLLGLSASSAAALLAACARENPPTTPPPSKVTPGPGTPGHAVTTPVSPVPTEAIEFPGPGGRSLGGAWAPARTRPEGVSGSVLVIHENRGLNDHIRSVAGRLAASGYPALAIDLLSEEGGTGAFSDPARATAALGRIPQERLVAAMKAGLSELEDRIGSSKLAAMGFCFGGGMVWSLLASGETRLAAAVPFYGPLPEGADLSGSKAAVLAIYAELDTRVNATREAARQALERVRLPHEIITFPGADHAFFNDTGPRYSAGAANDAYQRVLSWFKRYLG
ncbi:MAG: dienelactone hydrolase family protein [Actinomycetota bacterium]